MSTTQIPTTRPPRDVAGDDPVLDRLLDEELGYDPVARGGFINHLAMSLVAARRLGASDDELRDWFDAQAGDDFLVERERPSWLAGAVEELDQLGIDAVVRRELPHLIDAPLSQFFHAVIRLELAIDAGHAGQVANALQNLREHGRPLADPPTRSGGESFAAVVAALRAHAERRAGSMRDLTAVTEAAWFRDTLERLRVDEHLLDQLASFVIGAHTTTADFTTLHLVTGVRAMRALAPFLDPDQQDRAALRTAQAVAAVAVILLDDSGDAAGDPTAAADLFDWGDIGRAAIDSVDPHVAKLVYAARLEEAATGDPRYRVAAARQAGLTG